MEIGPIRPTDPSRRDRKLRRQKMSEPERHTDKDEPGTDLVPVGERQSHDQPQGDRHHQHPEEGYGPLASLGAQALSGSERRGLRAGPVVRQQAKKAYLNREYSGPDDRRPSRGKHGERDV